MSDPIPISETLPDAMDEIGRRMDAAAQHRRERILAAVRDFYRGNVRTQPGIGKGHSARSDHMTFCSRDF